jgi:uncharacterized phage-associated protein
MRSAYNPRKAAQAVAYLIQGRGGTADIIDAIKLVYLSDRLYMDRYDMPMLFDNLANMPHGPVNSTTYDAIKVHGALGEPWIDYLNPRRDDQVSVVRDFADSDFDELSRAEILVMDDVLSEHQNRKGFDLVKWIHENCHEWDDPRGSSSPLMYFEVWEALGRKNLDDLETHATEMRRLASVARR